MKKHIVLSLLGLVFSVSASAQVQDWDSVAVFYRPEKTVVQINERGDDGSRLKQFMNLFENENIDNSGSTTDIVFESKDKNMRIDCGRNKEAATCMMRFLPSERILLQDKTVMAVFALNDLDLPYFSESRARDFRISFKNSNGDQFAISYEAGYLRFDGRKR